MKLGRAWSAFWKKTKVCRSGRNYIPSHTPCEPRNHREIFFVVSGDSQKWTTGISEQGTAV